MNKEIVKGIVFDVILEKLIQVTEEMSTNEFIDLICDKVHQETGVDVTDDESREEVEMMIGDNILPLLEKLSEYMIESNMVGHKK